MNLNFEFESAHGLFEFEFDEYYLNLMNLNLNSTFAKSMNLNLNFDFSKSMNLNLVFLEVNEFEFEFKN